MTAHFYNPRKEQARIFGAMMEERRLALNISRKQLAKLANVSKSTIDNYAVGRVEPCALSIVLLARALECTTDYLLGVNRN